MISNEFQEEIKELKKNSQENPLRKKGLKLRGRGIYAKDKPPIIQIVSRCNEQVTFRVDHNLS